MNIFSLALAALSLATTPASAGVVVSVWTPGVAIFDPYDPGYTPAPRLHYLWISGGYDEYGDYVPGYWQPVEPNPGFTWSAGYWVGHSYNEGYWRPTVHPGHVWIDGYYHNGHHVGPRWVRAENAERAHAHAQARTEAREPRQQHRRTHHPVVKRHPKSKKGA